MALSKIKAPSIADDSITVDQIADTAVHGRRNLIINGAMQVAQRGDVTGVTDGYGGADRFAFARSGAAVVTLSQDTDVPSNQGFSESQKVDVTTEDSSLAAGDYALLFQRMEGFNCQQFLYGTSAAKKLTLQFWVKSSKTGTHIIELFHGDASYYNSQSYTIATADTWQKVTMTFDGYQTTAFDNDNGTGLVIHWWLAAGSTYSGGTLSENTWHNTNANRAVGQVNVMDSTSNNFYITGVQLELGNSASPFEHRSYGDELDTCHRYYYKRPADGSGEDDLIVSSDYNNATNNFWMSFFYPKEMRAKPTYGNASGWVTQSPIIVNEGVRWVAFNFTNGGAYLDRSTTFDLDAEL